MSNELVDKFSQLYIESLKFRGRLLEKPLLIPIAAALPFFPPDVPSYLKNGTKANLANETPDASQLL